MTRGESVATIVTILLIVLFLAVIDVWFWWPQVQDAVAYWGWPTW